MLNHQQTPNMTHDADAVHYAPATPATDLRSTSPNFDKGFAWGRDCYHDDHDETPPTYQQIVHFMHCELDPNALAREDAVDLLLGGEPVPYEFHLGIVAGFLAEYAGVFHTRHTPALQPVVSLYRS